LDSVISHRPFGEQTEMVPPLKPAVIRDISLEGPHRQNTLCEGLKVATVKMPSSRIAMMTNRGLY
jgi:hypothetical protein